MRENWLIIGHGSVGSSLASRLLSTGRRAYVYDPAPRRPLPKVEGLERVTGGPIDQLAYVSVCVPPQASLVAARFVSDAVPGAVPVFDWTSALPSTKQEAAATVAGPWVDVALLDSLDKVDELALLAVSGPGAAEHGRALERLSFEVVVVGDEVGQAAQTKLVRSLFMKALEALVVEARSIATKLDTTGTTWQSVERNLGKAFADFADLLVVTDTAHAARRGLEVDEAVDFARSQGFDPVMAAAAGEALGRLGALWQRLGPAVADGGPLPVLLQAVDAFTGDRQAALGLVAEEGPGRQL